MYVLRHLHPKSNRTNLMPPLPLKSLGEAKNEAKLRIRLADYPRKGKLQIYRTEDGKVLREWGLDYNQEWIVTL